LDISNIKLSEKSRALLDECNTIDEVNEKFQQVIEAAKMEALLPKKVTKITESSSANKAPRGMGEFVEQLMRQMNK
jgi:hypothetical protein